MCCEPVTSYQHSLTVKSIKMVQDCHSTLEIRMTTMLILLGGMLFDSGHIPM